MIGEGNMESVQRPKRPKIASYVKLENRGETKIAWIKGEPVILNKTAGDILSLCDGTRTIEEITKELVKKYNGDKNVIFSDLLFFIDEMIKKGVIVGE